MRIRGAGAVLALSWLAQTLADASGGNADLVVRYANEKKRFFRVSRG